MMRKVVAVIVSLSVIALDLINGQAAASTMGNNRVQPDTGATLGNITIHSQIHLFDGIQLTGQQRQRLRDLMQQTRYERCTVSINDLEKLHDLVIADKFDKLAVKAQTEKIIQTQVLRQVEIAWVRNQVYHLLTPDQQAEVEKKHQQRMRELRGVPQVASQQEVSMKFDE